jgi:predicted metal-dependent phosphoesterase TrpH
MLPHPHARAELHSHTIYSPDGNITFEQMMAMATRRQLDIVAITDHDTIEGALEFKRRSRATNGFCHIVIGEERTLSDRAHVIGLFLQEPIQSVTLPEAVSEIHAQGGVCILPHPFRYPDGALQVMSSASLPSALCFEVFNPKCNYHENGLAYEFLNSGWRAVGGSDAHYASDLGECVVCFPTNGDLESCLRKALDGESALSVWGVAQPPGDRGRKYAPAYYRLKPYLRVPRNMLPATKRLYASYRNELARRNTPKLELKHESH